jgi:NTE family protein
MKNLALTFVFLLSMTGCSLIENIEIMSDHIDDTTNPNALYYNDYTLYLNSLEKPENNIKILELRNKRREAVDKTMAALRVQGYSNKEKKVDSQQQKYIYLKTLDAQKSVKDYQLSAIKYNRDKWKISADNALKTLDKAKHYQELKKFEDAENKLKLTLLYLVNEQTALWLYQKKGKHVFPDYLKWGEGIVKESNNVINNPDTLVFSGGGARGPAYAGILKYLQETGKLKNVKRFIGTSAGSIMCTFMSIGTYYENNRGIKNKSFTELVYEIIEKSNFIDFIDNQKLKQSILNQNFNPYTDDLFSSVASVSKTLDNQYALCDGSKILSFLKKSLVKFGLDENITLGELYKKTGKHLVLVSCSISYRKTAYFDYKTAPDLPVVEAMRASMAIPFIFKPVKYNNDFFVDGGTKNNYPIEYFDYDSSGNGPKPVVLGFMLFSKKEMIRTKWQELKDTVSYVEAVADLAMFNTGTSLFKKNVDRTVFIDCGKIDVMSFNLYREQKIKLMQAGYDAIKKYYSINNEDEDNAVKLSNLISKKSHLSEIREKTEVLDKNGKALVPPLSKGSSWYIFYPEILLITPDMDNIYGINLGIPFSNSKHVLGFEAALFNNNKSVSGVQLGGINNNKSVFGILLGGVNNNKSVFGIELGGINNDKSVFGIQLGVINNINNKSNSYVLQLSAINNVHNKSIENVNNKSDFYALQLGLSNNVKGFIDNSENLFYGFQLALFNIVDTINGVQIGIYNKAKSAHGIQFGLINEMDNSWIKYMPLINFSF